MTRILAAPPRTGRPSEIVLNPIAAVESHLPKPHCAKRLECVELAPAFEPPHTSRQRQQAAHPYPEMRPLGIGTGRYLWARLQIRNPSPSCETAAFGGLAGPFPLTPALSPREREDRRPRVCKFSTSGKLKRRTVWLPLLRGEGRGEGERAVRPAVSFGFSNSGLRFQQAAPPFWFSADQRNPHSALRTPHSELSPPSSCLRVFVVNPLRFSDSCRHSCRHSSASPRRPPLLHCCRWN
jgi:hypothetical protein